MITYDKKTARFRDKNGRFLSRESVRAQIEATVEKVGRKNRDLTVKLNQKEITVSEWKKQMKENIKTLHTLSASVGKGGRRQMTKVDWGKVGSEIKKQYKYLDKFATDLKTISPKMAEHRASLYARNARTAYADMEKRANRDAGKNLSRRIIRSSETCSECSSWASKGFIDADEQPAIGSLLCRTNCRCSLEYR